MSDASAMPPPASDDEWPPRRGLQRLPSVQVEEIADGVYWSRSFANAGWVVTDEGVVLVDTGGGLNSRSVLAELQKTTDRPIRHIIYTHGHEDHVVGGHLFAQEGTQVIAHEMVPERLRKYELLRQHTNRINSLQFNIDLSAAKPTYRYPDITYHDTYSFELGGRRFELFHGRGETDDATVIHVPDAGVVFSGDFLIGVFPNVGNPFKVTRYGREWFETLERIAALSPSTVVPGHGPQALRGAQDVQGAVQDNIDALRFLHDEVCRRLNDGQTLDQMVAEIRLPERLEQSPHLQQTYSRVEFAVMNVHRRYAGWFDWDPTDLFPTPRAELARTVRDLIGDDARIVARAEGLQKEGRLQEALEVLQILLRAEPEHPEGRRLRLVIMEQLMASDRCLMSRGVWTHYAGLDRAYLSDG